MPKITTLERVDADIAAGDLGKARDRMNGLIASFPNDLELRDKLGRIYAALQYPAMAGRYWYLVENKTEEVKIACGTFERACGNDPMNILCALKFRGSVETLESDFAKRKLLSLQDECMRKHGSSPGFGEMGHERWRHSSSWRNKFIIIVYALIALSFVLLAINGCVSLLKWFM